MFAGFLKRLALSSALLDGRLRAEVRPTNVASFRIAAVRPVVLPRRT
jgi:hypothetical protein